MARTKRPFRSTTQQQQQQRNTPDTRDPDQDQHQALKDKAQQQPAKRVFICNGCGKHAAPKSPNQKWCSKACRRSRNKNKASQKKDVATVLGGIRKMRIIDHTDTPLAKAIDRYRMMYTVVKSAEQNVSDLSDADSGASPKAVDAARNALNSRLSELEDARQSVTTFFGSDFM